MRRVLLALIFALWSVTASAQVTIPPHDHTDSAWLKIGIGVLGAIGGADIATTTQAAERGGFRERNPIFEKLFEEPALLGLANGALTAGVLYTIVQWNRSEVAWKRISARVLLPSWIAARGYVVYHNVQELRR